jgi:glycosyltransferase involved in cell wall biosynthesis
MKIVYIHHSGSTGGAGNSLYYLLGKMKRDHDIHIITPAGPMADRFRNLTTNVHTVKGVPLLFTMAGFGLLRTLFGNLKSLIYYNQISLIVNIIRNIKPDLVHLNEIGTFSLAKRIKQEFDIPVVMHARTVPNRDHQFLIRLFTRKCNVYVDRLICITKSVALQYPKVLRKTVVYNPLHIEQADLKLLREINYKDKVLNVLFLSNFYRQKGVDETIRTIVALKDRTDIHFVLIGSNIRSDSFFNSLPGRILNRLNFYPDYESRIQHAIEKNRLTNVTVKGQVENITKEINDCHLLIAPMHLNGTPRSVFEAGIYGIPSILSLRDQIDDLVENGVNGIVIKERDHEELTEAVVNLASDRELLEKMGQAAKEKFLIFCTQEKAYREISEIYYEIIAV